MTDLPVPPQILRAMRQLQRDRETGEFCVHFAAGEIRAADFRPRIRVYPKKGEVRD